MKNIKRFIKKQFRKKSRVYIMPTSMGRYYIGLIALIFLLGVGYSNNLLLGLGLLLASLGLFWLIEAHFWMDNFKFEAIQFTDAEAGSPVIVKIIGVHPQKKSFFERLKAEIEIGDELKFKVTESQEIFHITPVKRGLYRPAYLKLASEGFLGLFYCWKFIKVDENFWVYPTKTFDVAKHSFSNLSHDHQILIRSQGRDYHRQYVPGDDAKRIDWKRWAKNSELFVFMGEEIRGMDEVQIQIKKDSPTLEIDLSRASYLITNLYQENRKYTLTINGEGEAADNTEGHYIKSMRRLAEC